MNIIFELPWLLIIAITVIQYVLGALWYSPLLFGTKWAWINNFDMTDTARMAEMQKQMTPYYILQLVITLITNIVFSMIIQMSGSINPVYIGLLLWIGIVMPTTISGIIWSSTEPEKRLTQALIMLANSFANGMIASLIFYLFIK